jgi:pimeloyl-ACP methyl ester carboxylesterase
MPVFTFKDININYIDVGNGEPLVFVCGTFTKLQSWNYQINYFKEKMRVIAFDNRGTGKSSRPDYLYKMEMLVEDLKNLLDYLGITEGVHLCASSMGAMISQVFALNYPKIVKTLILCAPTAYIPVKTCDQNVLTYDMLKKLDLNKRVEYWFPLIYSRAFRKRLREDKDLYDQISRDMNFCAQIIDSPEYKDYINQNEALRDFDIRNIIKNITQPTLILSGLKDLMSISGMLTFIHEQIPNSIHEAIPGMGHAFNIEAPEDTNKIMWSFLQKYIE